MAQVSNRGTQLFCSLFIVIGIVAVGFGVSMLVKSLRTEQWPVTNGVIQSAHMEFHSGGEGGTTYSAEVTYTYSVGGVTYTGNKVAIGPMSSSAAYAQGILNRYPIGKEASVHYAPGDPSEAVLEPGIHGGMWIWLGVGTAFALFGFLFLQVQRALVKAQMPGALTTAPVKAGPDGCVTLDKPPVLMGVIFLLAGFSLSFVPADSGRPNWLMYAVGAVFGCGGVMLLLMRLENKLYGRIASRAFLVPFLLILHWVSFGAGDRTGTTTSLFSASHLANVRTPFAIFTILIGLAILAGLTRWVVKPLRK